jgi:hypothetical protein
MCTDIKKKDVSGLVIIMCLADKVVHMVVGLNPVYTFVCHATSLVCCLHLLLGMDQSSVRYMRCFPCTKFRD